MASAKPELYFHPLLLNSQKALLALYESDLPFVPIEVNVFNGRSYTESFLKICNEAELPVLKCGDVTYPNLDSIFGYIDDKRKVLEGGPLETKRPGELEKYLTALLCKIDGDTLILGCLHHFEELGLKPAHPYNSEIYREKMKSMLMAQLPFLVNRMKEFPAFAESLSKRYQRHQHAITLALSGKRFNALLAALAKIFDICENELNSKHEEELWLFSKDPMSRADLHFGLLLHHLVELGFESTLLWKNHPKVDRYYRRFICIRNFRKILRMSSCTRFSRWRLCVTGVVIFACVYGLSQLWQRSVQNQSKSPVN